LYVYRFTGFFSNSNNSVGCCDNFVNFFHLLQATNLEPPGKSLYCDFILNQPPPILPSRNHTFYFTIPPPPARSETFKHRDLSANTGFFPGNSIETTSSSWGLGNNQIRVNCD
ncbi:hypothetical protein BGX38DRAFT_1183936, partial [Terfezia claveryi]